MLGPNGPAGREQLAVRSAGHGVRETGHGAHARGSTARQEVGISPGNEADRGPEGAGRSLWPGEMRVCRLYSIVKQRW
jgi:hypothetical protein